MFFITSFPERIRKLIEEDAKFVDSADQITPQDGLVYCRDDVKTGGYTFHKTAGISQTVVDEIETDGLKLYYRKGDQTIEMTHTRCQKGGGRLWFKCPLCGKRCGKLYRPLFAPEYACRECNGLVYRSKYKSASIFEIMNINSIIFEIAKILNPKKRKEV